ncbi:MAG: helix-turn-helix transcriptional regulator [Desulfobacterales bacterium]|nr:helix-turn-helix transcriptional regulator [Desulfobacterales bacterium]
MQVVVKRPHIKIEGEISPELIAFLKERYGEVDVIENQDEELVEIMKTDWYRDIRSRTSPGENLRIYRKLYGLSQRELGLKLGRFTRQNISNMERGQRPVSKAVAKQLAELFDVSVEKFI